MRTNCTLPLIFLLFACCLQAQEQLGSRLENFAGINSVHLNPAATQTTPWSWDLNLASAGVFAENRYAHIRNASLSVLLNESEGATFLSAHNIDSDTNIPANSFIVDYTDDFRKTDVSVLAKVNGPSLMLKFGSHSVGAFYNYRFAFSAPNLPANLNFYTFFNRQFSEEFELTPFDMTVMAWDETGLNYAYHAETSQGFFSVGANLKYLRGKEAAYFESVTNIDLSKLEGDSITTQIASLNYGLTTASLDEQGFAQRNNGTGFGLDIGVSMTFGGYADEGYDLKLGASILDLGFINFNETAQAHQANITSQVFVSTADFTGFQGVSAYDDAIQQFSEIVTGSPTGTLTASNFSVALPTALSLQADYSINKNIFVNALLVQRVRLAKPSVTRDNIFAISPRYEHRWFAFQMPFILHNYRDFRLGLSARLAFITIGSDNLGSLFGRSSEFTGTDLYAGVKVNPFNVGINRDGRGGNRKRGKRVKCYF